ncbi:hypothetical protein IWX83_000808 [Flavobacterium sp. CG_9.1]|uniref:hypothetical protein n=1 Tax=Flavobacterium sp. CG_9.1 TaxID=2787728 RepID=UPI0018CBEC31|nr:hypothetical protein [Flavobacterium sp. CG_9.1]MBG6061034.1 hypothetical protein [Flavobacterium sp. CG_9.1]
MDNIFNFFVVFLLMNFACKAQQMVESTEDVYLLKTNEQKFLNKPLKSLLKEIKPKIKSGYANNDNPFFFRFKFITHKQQKMHNSDASREDQVSLYVYVKDPIDWKWENRPKSIGLGWTKENAVKYGDLIVVRIKIIERKDN